MPKHLLKRYLPDPEKVAKLPGLGPFRHRLSDPSIWHLNRRSATGAVFWGLWFAFLPMPFHSIPAIAIAILFRLNLPLCLLMVWINNPITLLPIIYLSYHVGSFFLPHDAHQDPTFADLRLFVNNLFSDHSFNNPHLHLSYLVEPVLLGMLVTGLILGCAGYMGLNAYWRYEVRQRWSKRKNTPNRAELHR